MPGAGVREQGCREYFRRGLRKEGQKWRGRKCLAIVSFIQSTNIYAVPTLCG